MTLALVNILNRNFLFIKKIKNYIIIFFLIFEVIDPYESIYLEQFWVEF